MKKAAFASFLLLILLAALSSPFYSFAQPQVPIGTLSGQITTPTISPLDKPLLNPLLERLNAAQMRLEKIGGKITLRMGKLQKSGVRLTKLNTQYKNLTSQIEQLKTDISNLNRLLLAFQTNSNPKAAYPTFRKQIVSLNEKFKKTLLAEKSLLDEMKKLPVLTATPSVAVLPTK